MRALEKEPMQQLSSELALLGSGMLELESSLLKHPLSIHDAHRQSARNLAHYLALRRHDIRQLQSQLALLGLSSLGRTESNVLSALQSVHRVLNVLLGSESALPAPSDKRLRLAREPNCWTPTQRPCWARRRRAERSASWSPCRRMPPPTMGWCATWCRQAWIACASTARMTRQRPGWR